MWVKIFKGIKPMVYFPLITSLWVSHINILYRYTPPPPHILMWTYNTNTFTSCFLALKTVKWPSVHKNVFVLYFCKININNFHVLVLCLVPEYIHFYVIKNQTIWHDTSRVIVPYIYLFQRINNILTLNLIFFDEGKKYLQNVGNIYFCWAILDQHKPWNFEKCSLMK